MNQNFDIFISYRRDDGAQYARILQLELEKRGYKVFLDYEELKDGVFGDNIKEAIRSTSIFMMVLTPLYLERCVEKDSWVREEIELALEAGVHFIPVDPDRKFAGTPNCIPEEIANIVNNHQHSAIDFGQALGATVDLMIKNRICPHLPRKTKSGKKSVFLTIVLIFVVGLLLSLWLFMSFRSEKTVDDHPIFLKKAFSEQLVKEAEKGNPLAQYYMGLVMENGYGTAANVSEAVEWYKQAAEQGMDSAQVNLAMCYMNGTGITADEPEAVRWLKSASEKGNTDAMFNLGAYLFNKGEETEGREWLRKAVDNGNEKAKQIMEELGL